jgi:ABC-type dipeptide/oligopeptide/nickel transport system permease component
MVVVLFGVSIITFLLMHVVPGGPFASEKPLPADVKRNLAEKYGLNLPLHEQYLLYMRNVLVPQVATGTLAKSTLSDYLINVPLGGDRTFRWMNFGPSYASKTRTVNDIFRDQLPVSAQLGVVGILIALCIGIPLGIIAALNRNRAGDYLAMSLAITGVSVPAIVLAPFLVWIFGITLGWFPVTGWGTPAHLIMPAFAIGFSASALIARLTRASLLEVLFEDYVRTARAKGLSEMRVIVVHALKNAMIPVITILGPLFAALVTGTFVVETVFGIPGMGRYFVTSISNRDYPVIMGTILLYASLLVFANLLVDLTYAWLDPRIRYN